MKIMEKRNRSNPTTTRSMINKMKEKLIINAGTIAIMGITKAAMYRLLEQNKPLARFGKSFVFPSFTIFLDKMFRPEIQIELSSL
ncbi:hypothetical protein ACFLVW_00290 [Chloroflexota bacterium]